MSQVPSELRDEIPSFERREEQTDHGLINWTAFTSLPTARSVLEIFTIFGIAAGIFFLLQGILTWTNEPEYVIPRPISVVRALGTDFQLNYGHALWVTAQEFLIGVFIGSTIGLILAAVITQKPFVEKVITPYIIILVTTPMLAFVPALRLSIVKGFSIWAIVVAVALASGPMVLINASTGFRRTDLAKIALARSYGASTFQIFRLIRFPMALPMIIVGYMVGSIFGLLTAISGEMVSPSSQGGLGRQIVFFAAALHMPEVGATLIIVSALGVAIWLVFRFVGKRWASWEA
jgi:NitT/TauT family transport system permease protein